MNILLPVLIVAVIGLLAGLLLSAASVIMAVPKDETAEKLTEALPGANCGACGYSGCAGYAAALSRGEAQPGRCPVGGKAVAEECAAILGVTAGDVIPKAAVVRCLGICDNVTVKMDYEGFPSCAAAAQLYGGMNACRYGCLGLGDCVKVCDYHAIDICNGIAIINRSLCVGCGKCHTVCPKQLITLTEREEAAMVLCSNHDKGAVTRKACKAGCIGCMKCQKACPAGAVKVENFLASVDRSLCTNCGECVRQCPTGAIQTLL